MSYSIPYQTDISAQLTGLPRFPSRPVVASPPPIFGDPVPRVSPIQSGIAIGVAIATTASSVSLLYTPPTELRFELATTPAQTASASTRANPHYADVRPEIDQKTLIHVLQSQKVLAPVLQELQQQDIDLSYRRLKQGLNLQTLDNGNLEVRYQHSNPEVAQQVIEHLSQAYVAYGQECHIDACHVLPAINTEIQATQTRIQQTQQQLATLDPQRQPLDHQVQWITTRTAEIERHLNQVQHETIATSEHYDELRSHLSSNGLDIQHLLANQPRYQDSLKQLQAIEYQLALQQMDSQPEPDQMRDLLAHHQALMVELSQHLSTVSEQVRADYSEKSSLADVSKDSSLKSFDSEIVSLPSLGDRDRLEQTVLLAHHLNLLKQRQQALSPIRDLLQRRKDDLIVQMRDRDELNQQLDVDQQTLKHYQHQRQQLQHDIKQTAISWQIVSPPEMMLTVETGSLRT